jgi:radical SAM protein
MPDKLGTPARRGVTEVAPPRAAIDFARQPFLVIWETTRACDLACVHCRASAVPRRDPRELSTDEAMRLLDEVRAFGEDGGPAPLVVLTGGDPLKRPDIHEIVAYGTRIGLRMTMTPSGTPLMTPAVLARLRAAGLARLAVSLDGASRAVHDAFRRVDGSFDWTVAMLRTARALGLPTQVNTTITRRTIGDLAAMADLVADVGAVLWSVFLVVPTGRAQLDDAPDAEAVERAFAWLAAHAERAPHDVKTTAAPHFRRVLLQRRTAARRAGVDASTAAGVLHAAHATHAAPVGVVGRAGGVNDGNGFVFVGHRGDVHPSGFLPLDCGNVRTASLRDVYRDHPTFRALRDPDALRGKCGLCDFRHVCGGSRARAHAMTGDWRESDPLCAYEPPAWRRAVARGEEEPRDAYFARRVPGWLPVVPPSDP